MDPEFFAPLLSAIISISAAGIASNGQIQSLLRRFLGIEQPRKSYSERISELAEALKSSSRQVDEVLNEIGHVAAQHETAVRDLEGKLVTLEKREKEMQGRIESLKQVPLAALEHFQKIMDSGEKTSRRRDYALFLAGVVVSTIIAICLKLLGLG